MNFNLKFLFPILLFFAAAHGEITQHTYNAPLFKELKLMREKDQKIRLDLIDSGNLDSDEGKMQVEQVDQAHLPRLKAIIEQFGWPGFQLVGEEGSNNMWLLVKHANLDIEFQKRCLKLLEEAISRGDASKSHLYSNKLKNWFWATRKLSKFVDLK